MFVSCSSAKLVNEQIHVAIAAYCGFYDKLLADRFFVGVTANCVRFLYLFIVLCRKCRRFGPPKNFGVAPPMIGGGLDSQALSDSNVSE